MGEAQGQEPITISFLMLTIDRFDITKSTWEHNLKTAKMGQPAGSKWVFEYLVCDNGSKDARIVEYFKAQNISYHRINKRNEGVGHSFNQLFLRSCGRYIALLGNDIAMPAGWLAEAISYLSLIDRPGIVGYNWGHSGVPPLTTRQGIEAHWLNEKLNRVFGSMIFKRDLVEELGLFYEGYGPYGIEDSDLNERVNRAKFNSCYIPNMRSKHLVHDVGQHTEYRKMKDESLSKNLTIFTERVNAWEQGALPLKCELPPWRDPLT